MSHDALGPRLRARFDYLASHGRRVPVWVRRELLARLVRRYPDAYRAARDRGDATAADALESDAHEQLARWGY